MSLVILSLLTIGYSIHGILEFHPIYEDFFPSSAQRPDRPLVVEALTLNHEVEMLELRLNYSYDAVDYFLIVESTQSFAGATKPLHFDLHKDRFAPYMPKIRRFINDKQMPIKKGTQGESFLRQSMQRSYLKTVARSLRIFRPYDLFFQTDLDEIVNHKDERLVTFLQSYRGGVQYLENEIYYYDDECYWNAVWWKSVFMTYRDFQWSHLDLLRNTCDEPENVPRRVKSGWHLTYFGGPDMIREKLLSNSELRNRRFADSNSTVILDSIRKCKLLWQTQAHERTPRHKNSNPPPRLDHLWGWKKEVFGG